MVGGANWGSNINQIKRITAAALAEATKKAAATAARIKTTGTVRIPEDFSTLETAIQAAKHYTIVCDRMITIVIGKGEYIVDRYLDEMGDEVNYLQIDSSMNIIGKPNVSKKEIVVVGGIKINAEIHSHVHLQNMTIRQSTNTGVFGK